MKKLNLKDIVLRGQLVYTQVQESYEQGHYDENWDCNEWSEETENITVLGLKTPDGETLVLARELYNLTESLECQVARSKDVSVVLTYHITDKELEEDELILNVAKTLEGIPDADYGHHFSDLTGYLWTDEKFVVNRHDIIEDDKGIVMTDFHSA